MPAVPPAAAVSRHGLQRPALPRLARALVWLPLLSSARATQLRPLVLELHAQGAATAAPEDATRDEGFLRFPEGFTWGAATSAYQVEGAAAEGGRGPSVWDAPLHALRYLRPLTRVGDASGDVAADHYHRWKADVAIMAQLGLKAYRFSISWSRLLPEGVGEVNEVGAQFYSELIDELLAHGIEPWVTIYHWDLPAALNRAFKGWLGPKERMTGAFGNYSRLLFQRYGGRVKRWITLNEPWCQAMMYNVLFPAFSRGPRIDPYTAAHNQLLAHAEAARIYHEEFQAQQGGFIGATLNVDWAEPLDASSAEDVAAAQRSRDFQLGWFADPIYLGDYPASMRSALGERLPSFTEGERALLRGSSDFFGVNQYFAKAATPSKAIAGRGGASTAFSDAAVELDARRGVELSDSRSPITPEGLRAVLLYIQERYSPRGGIAITENGVAAEPAQSLALDVRRPARPQPYNASEGAVPLEDWGRETFEDPKRVSFLQRYIAAVHGAMAQGADVRAYFVWSLLDNLEWTSGYTVRFGLVRVDYATQKRTIKRSGRFYAEVIKRNGLDVHPTAAEQ